MARHSATVAVRFYFRVRAPLRQRTEMPRAGCMSRPCVDGSAPFSIPPGLLFLAAVGAVPVLSRPHHCDPICATIQSSPSNSLPTFHMSQRQSGLERGATLLPSKNHAPSFQMYIPIPGQSRARLDMPLSILQRRERKGFRNLGRAECTLDVLLVGEHQ